MIALSSHVATAQRPFNDAVINHDFADPTVIKANGKYYAYATNSTLKGKYSHIQLAVSTDMKHWADLPDALPAGCSWGRSDFWAPHVLYDKATKQYVMFYSAKSTVDSLDKCLGVALATSPEGPFIDMSKPLITGKSFINIDPFAFADPKTGKKLLYWGSGSSPIMVRELNDDWKSFKAGSEVKNILKPKQEAKYTNLIEGSWVDYVNGYYYLYYSGDNCCGTKASYAVMVARSKNALGPFVRLGETRKDNNSVILEKNEKWLAPGHNSIFRDDKEKIYIAYHSISIVNIAQGTKRVFLISPVVYKNGWPVVQY